MFDFNSRLSFQQICRLLRGLDLFGMLGLLAVVGNVAVETWDIYI